MSNETAWMYRGRDGEPVTLEQKLEQVMEFGSAMEKLAIENNTRANNLEQQLKTALEERDANAAKAALAEEALLDELVPVDQQSVVIVCVKCGAVGRREERPLPAWHKEWCSFRGILHARALSNPVGKEGTGGVPREFAYDVRKCPDCGGAGGLDGACEVCGRIGMDVNG